jgi:hypothetical protein
MNHPLSTALVIVVVALSATAPAHAGDDGGSLRQDMHKLGHSIHQGVRATGHAVHKGVRATGHAVHQGVKATGHAIHQGVDKVTGK